MFFLIRTAGRGRRRPAAPQKPAGPPMTGTAWLFLVVFLLAGAGLTALFKGPGTSNGEAFLMAFAVDVLGFALLAALCGGGKGKGRGIPADEVRAAYARQAGRLPAEMEAADREAREWKAAHPETFSERTGR